MTIAGGTIELGGHMAADWCAELGCVLVWSSTDRTKVTTLTPTGDPYSAPWQLGELSVSASNAVTPSPRRPQGTYGRFFYSRRLGGCGVINATNEPVYFFAIR